MAKAEPATAPHDGGALSPDDSGDRKSGHATAHVSRPKGQLAAHPVAQVRAARIAFRAPVADGF
ncbi:hypothetical protein T261_7988 [Streptomyces lydicus]|nr:hypothetical protein T261_7988 [Streptomyces lydicus]